MATVTVSDAARRLGVKPGKVRLLIREHKLSARAAPTADRRGRDRVLLDADEVDLLAQVRAHKRRTRGTARAEAPNTVAEDVPAAEAPNTAAEDVPAAQPGQPLFGEVEQAAVVDVAGHRTVALVQSMLAPLVAELHDARETIRRQAEELGALRTTMADLERRLALAPGSVSSRQNGAEPGQNGAAPRYDARPGLRAVGTDVPARAPTRVPDPVAMRPSPPLWRRVLAHMLT